jgi:hypothetical protein
MNTNVVVGITAVFELFLRKNSSKRARMAPGPLFRSIMNDTGLLVPDTAAEEPGVLLLAEASHHPLHVLLVPLLLLLHVTKHVTLKR